MLGVNSGGMCRWRGLILAGVSSSGVNCGWL